MGKKRKFENIVAEKCDEWLSTRNRKKTSPREPTPKRRHPLASRYVPASSNVQLTQNSPPPPQLLLSTKQSSLLSFFGTGHAKDLTKSLTSAGKRSEMPFTCTDQDNLCEEEFVEKGSNSGSFTEQTLDRDLHNKDLDYSYTSIDDRSRDLYNVCDIDADCKLTVRSGTSVKYAYKENFCVDRLSKFALKNSDSGLDVDESFNDCDTETLTEFTQDSTGNPSPSLPADTRARGNKRTDSISSTSSSLHKSECHISKSKKVDLDVSDESLSGHSSLSDSSQEERRIENKNLKLSHVPHLYESNLLSLDLELEDSEFTVENKHSRMGHLIDSQEADAELQNFSLDFET